MSGLWPSVLTVRHEDGFDVVLRALRTRDRSDWDHVRVANEQWLRPWEATSPLPPAARSSFRQLVRHYDREGREGRMQPFVIDVGGRIVGQMHLFGIAWGGLRGGAAGYWVARRLAGRGIAPLGLAALVDHAIYGLGLHRVEVNIRPENVASLQVVRKLGFREEGLRQRYLHIGGDWRDHRSFALIAEDLAGTSLVERFRRAQSRGPSHGDARPAPESTA
ncbi:putative ribosomal-protein-alanine acetyltransferase [Kineosphaera limosa NBRC 100340]|uniref:Putative ribosomal-protein-alanine acetyltransferase n=2 Tax=Kineosphaera TaxID=211469 RepID=K6WG17_9MICO|nr:GNAT family protein [Kineosphaera limosa]GAB98225.1 putative ribosomal-protein-alanine acetyltransferase [Kineosphaera limosa NBRC 100340]